LHIDYALVTTDTTISRGADENKNLTIRHRLGLLQQEYTYNNQPSGGTLISGNEFGRDEMARGRGGHV